MQFEDYYKTLGVERGADADAIKRAYRKLALKHHPDRAKEDERERAGLARIDAAERKAASSAESAWTRNAQRKPAQRKPGKVHILRDTKPPPKKTTKLSTTKSIARDASSAERAESPPPSPSPRRAAASHLKPSWL